MSCSDEWKYPKLSFKTSKSVSLDIYKRRQTRYKTVTMAQMILAWRHNCYSHLDLAAYCLGSRSISFSYEL